MYFLRQLRKFNLPQGLLIQFYSVIIESVLCTSITVWFSSGTKYDLIGTTLPTLQELHLSRVRKRAGKITLDPSRPAHSLFELLPSGRRYRALSIRATEQQKQFLTTSNPSHEHLTLNMEHTTHDTIIQLFIHHTHFFHFKFTRQTSHIIVCIVYCVFAILYIAYLYILLLLSVSVLFSVANLATLSLDLATFQTPLTTFFF